MAIHLLVVADRDVSDASREEILRVFELANETDTFRKRTCRSVGDFVQIVHDVALTTMQPIDVLDIYDHAEIGSQKMANGVLFDHLGAGVLIARALARMLTKGARVRLLGCDTAVGTAGQELLQWLQKELGGSVTVYGTIDTVEAGDPLEHDFDGTGFKQEREEILLFSSVEAATREAPTPDARARDLHEWYARL